MDKKKMLEELMLEDGGKPLEMVAPRKQGFFSNLLGENKDSDPVVEQAPDIKYPEPYEVDRKLRQEGFQIQPEKRLFFEKIARMLKR